MRNPLSSLLSSILLLATTLPCSRATDRFDQAPIHYSETTPDNPVSRLFAEARDGEAGRFDDLDERSFVQALLRALEIPESSQVLVFSKTSLQNTLIHPRHPRAIYFNDACYVGWVPGGMVEIAVQDDALGLVFYQLTPPRNAPPVLQRSSQCLSCHATVRTERIPGALVRSVFPDASGQPIASAGSFDVGPHTPIPQRWGGWYVTGQHGSMPHLGNRSASEGVAGKAEFDPNIPFANLDSLTGRFPPAPYLSAGSDIVALMILEHQVKMHNALNHAAYEVRLALQRQKVMDELLERKTTGPSESTLRVMDAEAERVVQQLLFQGEAELPDDGVDGDPAFTRAFEAAGPAAQNGRRLRDLELVRRMFKHRCSYMIHSRVFTALPQPLKQAVYRQLHQILAADTPPPAFAYLSPLERERILHILQDTLPDFAEAMPPE